MLAIAAGKFIFSAVMAPVRIFVFCLVFTLYIPCLATFGVIVRDLVRSGGGHRGIHHRCGAHRWWDCISGAHLHAFDKKGEAISRFRDTFFDINQSSVEQFLQIEGILALSSQNNTSPAYLDRMVR